MKYTDIKVKEYGVGKITKQNTTVDVKPGEIKRQAAKFGNKIGKDGKPPTLGKKIRGSKTNVRFNLGMAESKCGEGEYFCNESQKCKPIPPGYEVRKDGYLIKKGMQETKEIASTTEIFIDMDGVLADFFTEWGKLMGKKNWRDIGPENISAALEKIKQTENFWLDLPLTSNAKNLINLVKEIKGEYNILSSPLPGDQKSEPHKREWIKKNLSFFPPKKILIRHDKESFATQSDGTPNILIDDYGVNVRKWEASGGVGFKHKDHKFERTAKAIKQHMDEPVEEKWSAKYKSSINCSNPKGFSQKAHCAGRKKTETKEAPPGTYFTKSGNLVKGKLTKDAKAKGARQTDPKDNSRSKVPAVSQYNEDKRIPRKKGQPAGSKKHSDLYTDENPKGTIHGLKFATVADAKASVSKIRNSGKKHAHKIQAAVAMEQRAKAAGKTSAAAVYRKFINAMKKKTKAKNENITEALDNPYPVKWDTLRRDGGSRAKIKLPDDTILDINITEPDYGHYDVEFSRGGTLKPTGGGDEFRIFATVVSAVTEWWNQLDKNNVMQVYFSADKADGRRSQLYKRFAQMWSDKIGWDYDYNDSGKTVAFGLTNPQYESYTRDQLPQIKEKNLKNITHTLEYVHVDKIIPVQQERIMDNFKKQVNKIVAGDYNPIVVDCDNKIVNGHHRWEAAKLMGFDEMAVAKLPYKISTIVENFADGKKKGKSRPGRVKRSGASCKGSVTSLRAKAKKASGERKKMYHWCANMKSGRNKK